MRYCLKCKTCGETTWCRGTYESDVNALVLDDKDDDRLDCCEHMAVGGDYDVVDEEVVEFEDNYL